MKNRILAVCGAVAFAGWTVSAQQPPPQPQPQPTTPPTQQTPPAQPTKRPPDPYPPTPSTRAPMADVAGAVTLTGCLKSWDSRTAAPATGAGSGAGSAASTPAPGSSEYVLTNVERSEASRAAGVTGSSFLVKASDPGVVFSQHLNHKVQLTGTVSDAAKDMGRPTDRNADQPAPDKPSPDASASATGRGPGDMKMPILNVTALKMMSPTCGS
jgi:hypothetical protein